MLQPRNLSVTRSENLAKFWPVEHPFLVSINNYIRSTLSIRNGRIKKELNFVGLIAHVLL